MTPPRGRGAILGCVAAGLAIAGVSYRVGQQHAVGERTTSPVSSASAKVLYWFDPMSPSQHFDHPGKSPFMDMQLVPKLADVGQVDEGASSNSPSGLHLDPGVSQSLGMRTATATRGALTDALITTGVVEFDAREVAIVQARAAGFVQRVYARAPGDRVAAGAPLVDLLTPEWGGAEAEFLAVRRTGDAALSAAARQRLVLLGLTPALIASVERRGRPQATITVSSPTEGVIQKLDVRTGMTVAAGQTLAEVDGLETVWVTAAVPESQAARARSGQPVRVTLEAYPGETFAGRVQTILPQVAGESRTLQARIELTNRGGRLRPGLFAQVSFKSGQSRALLIPSEALIRTGRRTIVMLVTPKGGYEPVEVQSGRESGDQTEILAGLNEGDRVVASGQFLLDSEASLSGLNPRPLSASSAASPAMSPPAAQVARPALGPMAVTQGRVEAVAPGTITISHQPVPSLGWPAMTMTFQVVDPRLTRHVQAGDHVRFGFDQPRAGPTVRRIENLGSAR